MTDERIEELCSDTTEQLTTHDIRKQRLLVEIQTDGMILHYSTVLRKNK